MSGTVTWNPADRGPGVVLSNGNLTATYSSPSAVRATTSIPFNLGNKFYWEITSVVSVSPISELGVAVGSGVDLSGIVDIYQQTGVCATAGSAYIFVDGVSTGYQLPTGRITAGDIIQIAVDTTNQYSQKIWFNQNNLGWTNGDPGGGYGGFTLSQFLPYFPVDQPGRGAGSDTANFGPTMAYPVPPGFTTLNSPLVVPAAKALILA